MENKKHSSIPSNYVTLVQLQERWIKEQQRKQAEKEQQEREEQEKREREEKEQREREEREQREREAQEEREREEQERRLQEEKKLKEKVCDLKQTDKEETSETNSKSIIPQKPYRPHNYKANLPNSDEPQDKPNSDESQDKAEALNVIAIEKDTRDWGLKNDDQKKKKKKWNKRKPKRGEEVIGETEYGGTAEPETEKEVFEYFPARRGTWGNGIRGELRWKRKNPVANGKVSDSDDHVVMEVEQKFEDLSINNDDGSAHVRINEVSETNEDYVVVEMNGEQKFENLSINRGNEEGKSRSMVAMNGPRGWYRGPQRFCRGGWGDWNRPGGWGSWNRHRENGSWTWVRKGEGFDGNVRAQPN